MFRKPTTFLAVVLLAAVLAGGSGCAPRQETRGDAVAIVNGQAITEQQLKTRLALFKMVYPHADSDQLRSLILEDMIDEEILLQEAERRGIKTQAKDAGAEVARLKGYLAAMMGSEDELSKRLKEGGLTDGDLANYTRTILVIQALYDQVVASVAVDNAGIEEFFAANADRYGQPEMVKARHILVASEDKARDIMVQLAAGGDFAALARENSLDTSNKDQGGDLGYFRAEDMVSEFSDLAFSLQPGEVGGPVQTRFGFHVIKVEDRRPAVAATLDEVRERVRADALLAKQRAEFDQFKAGLKEKARIENVKYRAESK